MSSRAITMSEMSASSAFPGSSSAAGHSSLMRLSNTASTYHAHGSGGGDGPGSGSSGTKELQRSMTDLVLTPLTVSGLDEARMRGWGTRSIDLGSIPTVDGCILYQIRALLFARRTLVSLAVPALPDAKQVYHGVEIPSLLELTLRCSLAEDQDIIGALQAFAASPAHGGVTTLRIDGATSLPAALGRVKPHTPLHQFLSGIRFFSISGRDIPRPGESGLMRELFRFMALMPNLRKFEYGGYVPGIPAFQALRAIAASARHIEELTVAQGATNASPREDAHLHSALCALDPVNGPLLDLALRAALDAPETSALAGTRSTNAGSRLRRLDLTITPHAVRSLYSLCRVNATTLKDLRISVLPARDEETPGIWAAFSDAVAEAHTLDVVHFVPMLPRTAPRAALARVLQAAPTAVEVRLHAPGAATGSDVRDAYVTALRAAEGSGRLRRLWLCVATGPLSNDVIEARERFLRKAGSGAIAEIGKGCPGDGEYEPVQLLNPKLVRGLLPAHFLLIPRLFDLVLAISVIIILLLIGGAALAIAYFSVNSG